MSVHNINERGDTIVEVLIAIAIASSVLGATFATMNRNLLLTRDMQEQSEASKLAQGQIEVLKALSDAGQVVAGAPLATAASFCLVGGAVTTVASPSPTSDPATDVWANYPAGCTSGFYHFVIRRDTVDAKLYRFYVRWDRVNGKGRNQTQMVFRI